MKLLRKNSRRFTVFAVLIALVFTGCGSSGYPVYNLTPNAYLVTETTSIGNDLSQYEGQTTVEDIQKINGGNARMVFSDDGYLTFLNGKYCEQKVNNYEEAVGSLQGMASLLGLGLGSELFALGGSTDNDGYTYYTFQQRYGDYTIQYATLRVVIDPQGYTAGLSCSFTPNIGIANPDESYTAAQAEQVVHKIYPNYTIYSEYTKKTVVTCNDITFNTYAVYTNNPNISFSTFDMAYLEHFVAIPDGRMISEETIVFSMAVASPMDYSIDTSQSEDYFKDLVQYSITTTVTRYDGTKEELTVPVAYNPSKGLYYLADIERKILVGNYADFLFYWLPDTVNSTDAYTWDNGALLAYDRYIKAYDFYAEQGIYSTDGCRTPIIICLNMCNENGKLINNACYCGVNQGWSTFGVSPLNHFSEAVDVTAHEFTHGVTRYSMGGMLYANDTGAINEAFSDIMGNICEMMTGNTTDTTWLVGENTGTTMRSMSNPYLYKQPVKKSDSYFVKEVSPDDKRFEQSDYGGVHTNNSLLSQMAYKLWEKGMTLEEEKSLWITTIELMTPLSGYKEVHEALRMSVEINKLDDSWKQIITNMFVEAELL